MQGTSQEALRTHFQEKGFQLGFGDGQVEEKHFMRNPETFVTAWVKRGDMMLSEINETQTDKYCMISLVSGI